MAISPEEQFLIEQQFIADMDAKGVPHNKAYALEQKGWEHWLMTLFPFWFSEEFSAEHREYWELRWKVLMNIKHRRPNDTKDTVVLLALARGLGKSSVAEASRIMRGAVLGGGYSLIISETDDQAQEHLGNCRILIEHPESKLVEYYPNMAITEQSDAVKGLQTTDRREMFTCKNGYILRAKGLSAKMRGLRVGVLRPSDLCLDDVDDVNDSLVVSSNKLRLITASILPVLARENPTVDFSQNVIAEHSVLNQILTGRTDALAERTIIGPTPAFTNLDIDSAVDETGKLRHVILDTSEPSWSGLNVTRAQTFLNNSGLDTFLSEYQNEFDRFKSGKVIKEFDEDRQFISWSQFEAVFGERRIPEYWNACCSLDIGFSEGNNPHLSCWTFLATSAMNTKYPNKIFIYRAKTFEGISIDDQAEEVKDSMWKFEKPRNWTMSHEGTSEMMVLHKYKLPFAKHKKFGKEDGIAQWRHLSRAKPDTVNPFNGLEECDLYYIVDDDQLHKASVRDDGGLLTIRRQVSNWSWVQVKVTENGQTAQKPSKVDDDACDSIRAGLLHFGETAVALTYRENVEYETEKIIPRAELAQQLAHADDAYRAHLLTSQGILQSEIERRLKDEYEAPSPVWADIG